MNKEIIDTIKLASLVVQNEGNLESSATELLQVFATDGKLLGLVPRLLCHRLGLLHRVVFCFIGAPDGKILLQTRKSGYLDVAVGGHMNSNDNTIDDALLREFAEETGFRVELTRFVQIAEYKRYSIDHLSKPPEINNEFRTLFFVKLSFDECKALDSQFQNRQDKIGVLALQWLHLKDVLAACDQNKVADGLAGSISHYLLWTQNRDKQA